MPQTVLVAGGTSYLGSHVVAALKEHGHQAIIFDDVLPATGTATIAGMEVVRGALTDRSALQALFSAHHIDGVVYVPGGDSTERNAPAFGRIADPVAGAIALIGTAVEHDVCRVILSANGAIFGHPWRLPIDETEEFETTGTAGEAQHLIEGLLKRAQALHGLGWTCLRYITAAGFHPGRFPGMAYAPDADIVSCALAVAEGTRIYADIPGTGYPTADGTYVRDYVHVCDLAAAHVRALEALDGGGHRYNVGLDRGYSVHEVLSTVRRITGAKIPSRGTPPVAGEPPALVLKSTKIRNELGWAPDYADLEAIIRAAWTARDRHPRRVAVA